MTITAQLADPAILIFAQVLDLDWEGWQTEPRDWRGRWAHEGGAVAAKAQEYVKSLAGHVKLRELDDYDVGEFKRNTLDPAYHYTPEQAKAIGAYTEHAYHEINEAARTGHGEHVGDVDAISSAMQPMPEDLILLREVKGMHALGDLKPGDVIADPGFSSTTLIPGRFAGGASNTTVLHVLTPKGTPTVWANPASGYPEDEIILDRDQPMVVMGSRQRPGRSDVTDVHLLVLPKGQVT